MNGEELDPLVCESKITCLKHEQPITFRARRAHADKMKLGSMMNDLFREEVIRECT